MPYKFDDSHLYYHTFANWAAAAARTMLVWHNTNVWHTSPGALPLQIPPPELLCACHHATGVEKRLRVVAICSGFCQ